MIRMQVNFSEAELLLTVKALEQKTQDDPVAGIMTEMKEKIVEISGTGKEAEMFRDDPVDWIELVRALYGAEMADEEQKVLDRLSYGIETSFYMNTGIGAPEDEWTPDCE